MKYAVTYHFLSCFVAFLVVKVDEVSGRADLKTKLLLKNIRTHLTEKVEEVLQEKECRLGSPLCKATQNKPEKNEEESEEISLFTLNILKDYNKPTSKTISKTSFQTPFTKTHKSQIKNPPAVAVEKSQNPFRYLKEKKEIDKSKKKEKNKLDEEKHGTLGNIKKVDKVPKAYIQRKQKPNDYESEQNKDLVKENAKDKRVPENLKKDKKNAQQKSKKGKEKKLQVKDEESNKVVFTETEKLEEKEIEKSASSNDKNQKDNYIFPTGAFFLSIEPEEVDDSDLCSKHTSIYLKQLKRKKIWALMMFDASAKLPSGILQGNINQFGDFDECLSINAVFKKPDKVKPSGIKGKYCLANIDISTNAKNSSLHQTLERAKSFSFIKSTVYDPGHFIPKFSSINWGLCVPDTCQAEDVKKLIDLKFRTINDTTDIAINFYLEDNNCTVKKDLVFEFSFTLLLTVIFYLIFGTTAIYATYLDKKSENKSVDKNVEESERIKKGLEEASKDIDLVDDGANRQTIVSQSTSDEGKLKKLILAFSLKRSLKKLFDDESEGGIKCINGIKSVFSMMLYFAHKTIPLGWTSFSNRIFFTKVSNNPTSVILRASLVYTDSFLFMSGLLTSYNLSREIMAKKKISWSKKLFARFIRLTPALLAVLLFYAYVWNHMGSGPLWNSLVKKNSNLCQNFMWRNLLYIQNFFPFEKMCAPQTHQLALDMQLSLLAPFFVSMLFKYDKLGFGVLQALFLASSIMRYYKTSHHDLSVVIYHGMSVSQLYRTADKLYTQTLYRASPYILGTVIGHYLQKLKTPIEIPRVFAGLGWIISFSLGFYSIVSPSHMTLKEYEYNEIEAAQYAALSPVTWSFALSWVIVACHLGIGGKLNEILCNKGLLVLSRISYSLYLTQFLVFFYTVGVKKVPEVFTLTGCVDVKEFFLILSISTLVTLVFDIPMMEIKKILFDETSSNFVLKANGEENEMEKDEIPDPLLKGNHEILSDYTKITNSSINSSYEDERYDDKKYEDENYEDENYEDENYEDEKFENEKCDPFLEGEIEESEEDDLEDGIDDEVETLEEIDDTDYSVQLRRAKKYENDDNESIGQWVKIENDDTDHDSKLE